MKIALALHRARRQLVVSVLVILMLVRCGFVIASSRSTSTIACGGEINYRVICPYAYYCRNEPHLSPFLPSIGEHCAPVPLMLIDRAEEIFLGRYR